MEASLCCSSTSTPPPLRTQAQSLALVPLSNPFSLSFRPRRRNPSSSTTIRAAISRAKKEQTVEVVKKELEGCHLIAGIRYKGLTVKELQDLRAALPPTSRLLVAKNTLVSKAVEGTSWASIAPCLQGMNAWLFVHSEEIPEALKPYRTFQRERKLEENDFTGAVFEGKFYAPHEFKSLETMPSRAEIYGKILGAIKSPSISLVSTLQAPARDVVLVLKAYVRKLEEQGAAA
ncbi:large ribosomal subunit protein uL10c [Curcuma longa]|uniref:large ribosomal subunit protein uL10c n=1 Tax=Curcuma longa TaxID=136217 RepID=UPI003D9F7115